ncbi:hypothetical protein Tco_0180487 [Tanacetum coccineum]
MRVRRILILWSFRSVCMSGWCSVVGCKGCANVGSLSGSGEGWMSGELLVQYFDVYQPPEEISIEELKTMMQSYCEIMSQRRKQDAILLQKQAVKENQELLAEEQAANPSEPSPVSYFYNADYDNISTPSTTYTIHLTKSSTIITNPSKPTRRIYHDIFYDGDDDEELFPDEIKRIQQILERTSFDGITPDFLITDSLSIGDEHLSTILETESDKLIKSSVENLVPAPSDFEDLSKDLSDIKIECNVPVCDDLTTVSNPLFDADNDFSSSDDESLYDEDVPAENFKIYSNPLFDEEIISTKIDMHHFNAESDLIESLLNRDISIVSSPKFDSLLEEFSELNPEVSDAVIESFSPSPITVEDSDSLMKEIDLFLTSDDSMPPGKENDDYDSEGDIIFLEELLSNDSPSLLENESFHFDVPSSRRPPMKPPDDGIYFDPNTGLLTAKVVGDISKHYVLMTRILPTQPTLCPLSSFLSESPMMIYGGNIPTLDVPIAWDFEASRARGFVLRSLELQSFA